MGFEMGTEVEVEIGPEVEVEMAGHTQSQTP